LHKTAVLYTLYTELFTSLLLFHDFGL